jgi:hypothetical protein
MFYAVLWIQIRDPRSGAFLLGSGIRIRDEFYFKDFFLKP